MISIARAAILAAAIALPTVSAIAQTQSPPDLRNNKVKVDYLEPRDPGPNDAKAQEAYKRYRVIYERMVKRQVLEEFAAFMAPLRLPVGLRVRTQECNGQVNAFYDPSEWTIKLCYEFLDNLEAKATKSAETQGFSRAEAVVGGFLMVLLHEAGHAMSDIFDCPCSGARKTPPISSRPSSCCSSVRCGADRDQRRRLLLAHVVERRGLVLHFDTHSTGSRAPRRSLHRLWRRSGTASDLVEKRWLQGTRRQLRAEYQQVRLAFRRPCFVHRSGVLRRCRHEVAEADDGKW